jgi:hypothetical protein
MVQGLARIGAPVKHGSFGAALRPVAWRQTEESARHGRSLVIGDVFMGRFLPRLARSAIVLGLMASPALATSYEFLAPPQLDLNRLYRLDKTTGEVTVCQYLQKEGTLGMTACFPAGEGAGKQEPGDYALVASRHEREGGIYRVEIRTGAVSVCFLYQDRVVCTPADRPK